LKVLRLDVTNQKAHFEKLDKEFQLLGNRGLIAEFANQEIPPACNPLGRHNKLIIAIGPLVGFNISSAARVSVGGKSPLTGGIKEANSGGVAGQKMGKQGIRAIILEGLPPESQRFIVYIHKDGVEYYDAEEYAFMGNYETARRLLKRFGDTCGVISIGPTGEYKMASAGVFVNDTDGEQSRACARGGMGAVMGSKGIKAIVIADDGEYKPAISDPEAFKQARKAFHDVILNTPQTKDIYRKYGTASAVMSLNQMGAMPTYNFRAGSFEYAEDISGDALYDLIGQRKGSGQHEHSCMSGCIIKCSNVVPKEDGSLLVSPLEYESIGLLGSNLGIKSLDAISQLNYQCNDIGVDSIEAGAALGVAVDAGLVTFGDEKAFMALLEEVATGTPLGRILGQGAAITAKVFGIARAPVCKGQAFAAHEPRGIKGMAITYALSPMGADHTAAVTFRAPLDHSKPDGQMELSRNVQVLVGGIDTLGLCMFVVPAVGKKPELIVDMLNTIYGTDFSKEWITRLGKKVLQREREFNLAAGLGEASDRLPEFCEEEPLPPHNQVVDIPEEDYKRFWDDPEFWSD
jgi:aldehyde:ferredoxin oxidoreductase